MRRLTLVLALLLTACAQPEHGSGTTSSANVVPTYPVVPLDQQKIDVRTLPPEAGLSNPNCGLNGIEGIEKEFVARLNQVRAQARMCGTQKFEAAPPIRWNIQLLRAAYHHSVEMARTNVVSHTSLDARALKNRINQTGYFYEHAGENIAAGQSDVATVIQAWVDSPPHCATLMEADFKEIGAACVYKKNSFYRFYWTLDMALPMPGQDGFNKGDRRNGKVEDKEVDWKETVVR